MITFNKIRWKNILSFGNYYTELNLSENNLTVIVGSNGAGKSSFLDCLSFVLFAKTFRKINKPQIVNSITKKNALVEVEFNSYGHDYKVIRGIKPAVFEIWEDGVLRPSEASSKRTDPYQDYLEKEVLKCDHKTFCQLVILGAANYQPFFDMDAAGRRKFVEFVFSLEIISVMNTLQKQDMTGIENKICELQIQKSRLEFAKKSVEEALSQKTDEDIQRYQNLIEDNQKEIEELESDKAILTRGFESIDQDKLDELNKNIDHFSNQLQFAEGRIKDIERKIKEVSVHKNETCPTCHHWLSAKEAEKITSLETEALDKFITTRQALVDKLEGLRDEREIFDWKNAHNRDLHQDIEVLKTKIGHNNYEIEGLERNIEASKTKKEAKIVEIDDLEITKINIDLDILARYKEKGNIVLDLLRDDGVKAYILKDNIDKINELVNSFLMDMDFFCSFTLNEEFEEVIKSRYRDEFSYHSFSQGERLRISLALLLTWREISKRRASIDTNLLIFDEILDSSLDQEGVDLFLNLIKKTLKGRNCFIISHNTGAIDKIDNVIKVKKFEGFSRYETE